MLIKIASNEKLSRTFGPTGAICVRDWEGGTEIRYKEQVVLFWDKAGEYMVGFTFSDVIVAAAIGTPKQFHDEVRYWLGKVKLGETPPQRLGHVW